MQQQVDWHLDPIAELDQVMQPALRMNFVIYRHALRNNKDVYECNERTFT